MLQFAEKLIQTATELQIRPKSDFLAFKYLIEQRGRRLANPAPNRKGARTPYRPGALDIQRPEFVMTLYREVNLVSRTRPTRVVARIGLSRHSSNQLTVSLLGCKVIASPTSRSSAAKK